MTSLSPSTSSEVPVHDVFVQSEIYAQGLSMVRAKYAGQPEALLPLLSPEEASEILEIPLSQISEAMKLGGAGFTFRTVVSPDYAYERATAITAGKAV
jgi:hypothetical protein